MALVHTEASFETVHYNGSSSPRLAQTMGAHAGDRQDVASWFGLKIIEARLFGSGDKVERSGSVERYSSSMASGIGRRRPKVIVGLAWLGVTDGTPNLAGSLARNCFKWLPSYLALKIRLTKCNAVGAVAANG